MKKIASLATELYATLDLRGLESYVERVQRSYETDLKYGRSGQTNKRYVEAGLIALTAKRNAAKAKAL